MNIFKFEIDLSRKDSNTSITSDIKDIYANELENPADVDNFLNEEQDHSGQNFKNIFSEKMLIAVGERSSGRTKYFVTKTNPYPKKGHEVVCVLVKTEDENIFKQFKWVRSNLKEYCKEKSIKVDGDVTDLYLFVCDNNDVLYPNSSIRANIDSKDIDVFTILCLFLEAAIAAFIAVALYYNEVDLLYAISIWIAVGIPFIMEIKDWCLQKLIIENLSQNVKSEPNRNDGNPTSPTKKRQNGNSKLKAPPTGTQQGLASASSIPAQTSPAQGNAAPTIPVQASPAQGNAAPTVSPQASPAQGNAAPTVPAQASLAQGNTASVTPPPTPSAQENTAPSANH